MLVLSRNRGQAIVIGSDIRIRIGEVCGGWVKLLIETPRNCTIRRGTIRREEVIEAGPELAVAVHSM